MPKCCGFAVNLPDSGLQKAANFELEVYDERFNRQDPESSESICEILVPVKT